MKKLLAFILFEFAAWNLFAAGDVTLQQGSGGGTVTIQQASGSSGSGDIESVTAGAGLSGGGLTGALTVSLDPSATHYIQNTNTLQTGSTFYVSSGTVNGQLTVESPTSTFIKWDTPTYGGSGPNIISPRQFVKVKDDSGTFGTFSLIVSTNNSVQSGLTPDQTSIRIKPTQGSSSGSVEFSVDGVSALIGTKDYAYVSNKLRIVDPSTGFSVGFSTPSSIISANVNWKLPSADGSNTQVLTTNGSGDLSWTTPSASGSSTLAVGTGTASNFTNNITSPTAAISFRGDQFNSIASGTTNFINLTGVFTATSASAIPVVIIATASQTSNLLQVTSPTGTIYNRITSSGAITMGSVATLNEGFTMYSSTDETTNFQRLRINSTAGNVLNYNLAKGGSGSVGYHSFQISGTPVFEVDSSQAIYYGNMLFSPDNTYDIGRLSASPFRPNRLYLGTSFQVGAPANTAIAGSVHAVSPSAAVKTVVIQGAAGQTANLIELLNSSSVVMSSAGANGNFTLGSTTTFNGPIFDGYLSAGTSGYALASRGMNTPPVWKPNVMSFTSTYKAAVCQGSNASLGFSGFSVSTPTAACVNTSSASFGVAQFTDNTSTQAVQDHFSLPSDWTGAVDANIVWRSTATSGDVVWQVRTSCVADGEVANATWNTASTVTDTAKATTLQFNTASITGIATTGCSAGEELFFDFYRNPTHASDTLSSAGELVSLMMTIRRTY